MTSIVLSMSRALTYFIALQISAASAWEATYNANVSQPLKSLVDSSKQLPSQILLPKNIEYPTTQGVSLGQGWDFFLNRKTNATCIDFKTQKDSFQTSELVVREATDEETRDITLNSTFEAGGEFSIGGFGGGGSTTSTSNSFSHFYSKDILFVAHATVTNGAFFVIPATVPNPEEEPPKQPSANEKPKRQTAVGLLPEFAAKRENNPDEFRRICGDGFVASINFGSDLYSLFTFHASEKKTRDEIRSSVQASGGLAGFSAHASGGFAEVLEILKNDNKLRLEFVQKGGKIRGLPIDLISLQEKVKNLATEAWEGPRPTFMVIFPYSELPALRGTRSPTFPSAFQAALRYQRRLVSIHSEIMDMQSNYLRDRTGTDPNQLKAGDEYLFSYWHELRSENLQLQRQEIEAELLRVNELIKALAACFDKCRVKPGDEKNATSVTAVAQTFMTPQLRAEQATEQLLGQPKSLPFDDLKFWLRLPLPLSALPKVVQERLSKPAGDKEPERRALFARYLYKHWIERQDQGRCALYNECLNQEQQAEYYNQIVQTLAPKSRPSLIHEEDDKTAQKNEKVITIAACTRVLLSNYRASALPNRFTVFTKNANDQWTPDTKINLIRRPGELNANLEIPALRDSRQIKIAGWYSEFFPIPFRPEVPMVSSTVHYGPLSATVWFQDPGSNPAIGANLYVVMQAIPEPAPNCTEVNAILPAKE